LKRKGILNGTKSNEICKQKEMRKDKMNKDWILLVAAT